jgi:hypothetical protein
MRIPAPTLSSLPLEKIMTSQTTQYSPDFQRFLQLVQTALVQAAADARELAERTGTPLVVRDTGENQVQMGLEPTSRKGNHR